ncbi:MAG: Arm DNA-binding domain-containing protein [Roseobacter sp.]
MVTNPCNHIDGHGLFLKGDPSGTRTWVQRIVIRDKRTEIDLGSALLASLAEARERALKNRKLTRVGSDPLRANRKP